MEWPAFLEAYRGIIARTVAGLRPHRFACFVVADFRDQATGFYRGFIGETVRAFAAAGCEFYNEAVFLNMLGTQPVRVSRQFPGGRKLGKAHQNILVFCKGNWKLAVLACTRGVDPETAPPFPPEELEEPPEFEAFQENGHEPPAEPELEEEKRLPAPPPRVTKGGQFEFGF
jgi:hypothetical protein